MTPERYEYWKEQLAKAREESNRLNSVIPASNACNEFYYEIWEENRNKLKSLGLGGLI